MELAISIRESLVDALDDYLENMGNPLAETVVAYLVEQLETYGDEYGIDDIISALEDEGSLDGTLSAVLEDQMESNDEFEYTGEEIAILLEGICEIEWIEDPDADDDDDDEDDD